MPLAKSVQGSCARAVAHGLPSVADRSLHVRVNTLVADHAAHLCHKDKHLLALPAKVVGEEEHAPSFNPLIPHETSIHANLLQSLVGTPRTDGKLEAMLDDAFESGADHVPAVLVHAAEAFAKGLTSLQGNFAPFEHCRIWRKGAIVTSYVDTGVLLLEIAARFQVTRFEPVSQLTVVQAGPAYSSTS